MPSYNYFVTPSPEILDFLGALGVGFSATLIESVSSVPYTFWRPQSCIKEFIINPTNFTVVVSILSFYDEKKISICMKKNFVKPHTISTQSDNR